MAKTAADLRQEARQVAKTADEAGRRVDALLAEAQRLELAERRAAEKAAADAHYAEMRTVGTDYGLSDAQHAIVYSKAYDEGHHAGYSEVATYYSDFAQFAIDFMKAK